MGARPYVDHCATTGRETEHHTGLHGTAGPRTQIQGFRHLSIEILQIEVPQIEVLPNA